MKTLSNLVGCSTYLVSDSANNRCNFTGPFECTEEIIEMLKGGSEVELSEVDKEVLNSFKENGVDLSEYTHCIIVNGEDYYLAWE